ncbi:MAG TPA: glycosyltransferase family 1 protein [Chloroflexia bacterium]|nr:glycosyltransferase family 1 protein [Chloroflexia bacterium]
MSSTKGEDHPLRIAIDYTTGAWPGAGVARYTRSLVTALANIDQYNHYTLFYGGRDLPRDTPEYAHLQDLLERRPNLTVRELPLSARALGILWQRLRAPLPANWLIGGADVVHAPDFLGPPVVGARQVVTIHDLSFLALPEVVDPGNRDYLARRVPRAARRAHRVIAVSEATRQDVIRYLRVPPERVVTVPNGVDQRFRSFDYDRLAAEAPARRAQLGVPERYILHVGTIEPRKTLVRLIGAYMGLVARGQDDGHDLVLAGRRGWMYDLVFDAAAASGLQQRIHFLDYVPEADLPWLYNLATVFVYPSLYEGFGLPVLEAMACGTPVVTSRTPALVELVGDATKLVDPIDEMSITLALELLVNNPTLRRALHEAGLLRAAAYPWSVSAHLMLGVYTGMR